MFGDAVSMGWTIGLIALVVCLILSAALIGFGIHFKRDRYWRGEGWAMLIGGIAFAVITVGVWVWASWPIVGGYDYHHWVDKQGTVTQVSKRLVPAGDSGMQEKIVMVIGGQPYGVLDTRAALVKPGDSVHLRCKKAYEFGVARSSHGWDCKWYSGDISGAAR